VIHSVPASSERDVRTCWLCVRTDSASNWTGAVSPSRVLCNRSIPLRRSCRPGLSIHWRRTGSRPALEWSW
jgi:hypothetical protein